MSNRCDKHDFGVGWIHQDLRYVLGISKPDVCPCGASVRGPVHTVTECNLVSKTRLSHTNVDNISVGRGNPNRANGEIRLMIEDRLPANPAVGGLPYATRYGPEIVHIGFIGQTRDGFDAAPAKR